jgi:hypothetical protein
MAVFFLNTTANDVEVKDSGRIIRVRNSGGTWYWFGCPYSSSVVIVFPIMSTSLTNRKCSKNFKFKFIFLKSTKTLETIRILTQRREDLVSSSVSFVSLASGLFFSPVPFSLCFYFFSRVLVMFGSVPSVIIYSPVEV